MHKITYTLAGLQVLFLIAMFVDLQMNPTDKAGYGMGMGFLMIYAIALAILLIPAVLIARSERWGALGLILTLIFPFLLLTNMGF